MKKGACRIGFSLIKLVVILIVISLLGVVVLSKFSKTNETPAATVTAENNNRKYVWKQVWAQELLEQNDSYTGNAAATAINTTLLQCKNVPFQDWKTATVCADEVAAGAACGQLGSKCVAANGGCAGLNLHYCEFGMARQGVNANKPCDHTASDSFAYYLKDELCANNKNLIEQSSWRARRYEVRDGCMRLVTGLICAEE